MATAPDEPEGGPRCCSAPELFEAFFKEHRGAVFRTILARTMDPDAADEATAEAFTRAYVHWDDTVAEHPNPLAWVLRVAWNHHLSWWRTWEHRRAPDPPAPTWPTPQPPVDPKVVAAIRSLPSGQRDVLVLAALGGLALTEIAELLGKAPGTVRAQLHRARTRLRLALDEGMSSEGQDD